MTLLQRLLRLAPAALLVPALALAAPEGASGPSPSAYLRDGRKVSLFAPASEGVPVARVGGEAITVRELADGLAASHQAHGAAAHAEKRDPTVVLDRLVDLRLMALEARAMGIADLPEFRSRVEEYRAIAMRDVLKEGYTRSLRPAPEKVEAIYRDAVREWKVRSLLFTAEADARDFAARAKDAAAFQAAAVEALAQKKAQGTGESDILPEKKMLKEVLAEVRKLSPGQVSPAIKVAQGWAVVLLEAKQYPDVPDQWAAAQWQVLQARHNDELVRQYQRLKKKYARVDRALYKKLDFEADKPGMTALLKDKRPLVRIPGEAPLTVGDLAQEVRQTYFHGTEEGSKVKKQLNARKESSLDNLLGRRLFSHEARVQKIQDSPELRHRVEDFERSLLVGTAIERAVAPDVRVTETDAKAFYEAHRADYTYPQFLKLEALAFAEEKDAEATLKKLRAGTDFQFLSRSADGRLDPEAARLRFEGVLSAAELPPEAQKSLAGVKGGEYRLHRDGDQFHVIHVLEEVPPQARSLDEVRADVEKRARGERLGQAVKDWVAKLRQAYPVEVYVARIGD